MNEVKDLYFTYPNAKESALHGIDFSIREGEAFGFLGLSGAGKSTTQKILIGVLKNYLGCVKVMGKEIKYTGPEYFEHIGVAFEFPNFYTKLHTGELEALPFPLFREDGRAIKSFDASGFS